MNCGHVCLLQKLWCRHIGCVLQKLNGDGLCLYCDGLPLQCSTLVSDGFALMLGDQNPFRPCCNNILIPYSSKIISCRS